MFGDTVTKVQWAKLACIFAGIVWGVYWIPLRMMATSGIVGLWATVMFYLVPLALLAPLVVWRWRDLVPGYLRLHLAGFLGGFTFVLYANAFMFTEVVRAMLLYYLTPIWGFLLARAFLGEAITPIRWISMLLGFTGILIIFGIDAGLPLPRNIGDWMGLISGMTWAIASLILLMDDQSDALNYTLVYFFWGTVVAILIALFPIDGVIQRPDPEKLLSVLPWLVPFIVVLVIPGAYAAIYGPTQLNPGVVGLLYMTEISVGVVSAAIWAGEPFGTREMLGVALITLAGLAEPLLHLTRERTVRVKTVGQ